jgi:hypothetical protein
MEIKRALVSVVECGSGSCRIDIIFADPEPDPYPFQQNVKLNYTSTGTRAPTVLFSRELKNTFQNIDQLYAYLSDADEKR